MSIRSEVEIQAARSAIVRHLMRQGLSSDQVTLLKGMSVALQWACGHVPNALDDLLNGRPIVEKGEVNG